MKQPNILVFLIMLPLTAWPIEVLAHGSKILYRQTQAIQIQGVYSDGKPMKNAQVVIYAPNEPTKPWLIGTTDSNGYFTFIPNSRSGNWEVKVSQSGHGDKISIAVGVAQSHSSQNNRVSSKPTTSTSNKQEYTPLQTALMAATGVWGFIGTALFFSRSRHKTH